MPTCLPLEVGPAARRWRVRSSHDRFFLAFAPSKSSAYDGFDAAVNANIARFENNDGGGDDDDDDEGNGDGDDDGDGRFPGISLLNYY